MKIAWIVPLALAAGLAGCAATPREAANLPPPPPSGAGLAAGQCFRTHDIRSHTVADDHTLLLSVGQRDVYRVTLRGGCLAGASSSDPIITEQPPGSQITCRPLDLDLSIATAGATSRCIVDSIAKLSPEQAAALPGRLRP